MGIIPDSFSCKTAEDGACHELMSKTIFIKLVKILSTNGAEVPRRRIDYAYPRECLRTSKQRSEKLQF